MSSNLDTSDSAACSHEADALESLCASHAPVSPPCRFPSGAIFGDWRLTAFIGSGGNGEVYCAEHATLGTSAAVKVLMREDERAKTRFAKEASLLSDLKSEAFPRFFAYGEANGRPYLAMELLEPGELPTGDHAIASFLLKVCDAVAELHERGYLHRDIKPGNILWRTVGSHVPRDRGRASLPVPVLADLGLVKEIKTTDFGLRVPSLTVVDGRRAGVGTPGYGAPEQVERGEATVASDIHALGVLADRCFDGNPPRVWAHIIQHATSSIPARRYPSVASFARAIRWRHLLLRMSMAVALVSMLAVAGIALRRLLVPFDISLSAAHLPVGETSSEESRREEGSDTPAKEEVLPEQTGPVLSAVAILDGKEAKDARWFLDDIQIEMPYRLAETDMPGKLRSYKWLHAVVRRNGKVYSAKEEGGIPNWNGARRFSLTLREDPAAGTQVRVWSPGGVPFDFVWHSSGEGDAGSIGYGYWMAAHSLTGRQLGAIVEEGLLYTPFAATKRYDFDSDEPVKLEYAGATTIPVFTFRGAGVVMGPPAAKQLEAVEGGSGNTVTDVRLVATSGFANETNVVLHCIAMGLLRSGDTGDVAKGEKMLQGFMESGDEEFAATAREICLERGVMSLESCGENPQLRFRRAAVQSGNVQTLERLATTDSDSDIRTEAYERLQKPSQMLSARYVAKITADFSDDIGKPIKIIQAMTDRAALEYVAGNAALEYFQDLAKERLARIKH